MENEIDINRYYLINEDNYFFSGIENIVEEEFDIVKINFEFVG